MSWVTKTGRILMAPSDKKPKAKGCNTCCTPKNYNYCFSDGGTPSSGTISAPDGEKFTIDSTEFTAPPPLNECIWTATGSIYFSTDALDCSSLVGCKHSNPDDGGSHTPGTPTGDTCVTGFEDGCNFCARLDCESYNLGSGTIIGGVTSIINGYNYTDIQLMIAELTSQGCTSSVPGSISGGSCGACLYPTHYIWPPMDPPSNSAAFTYWCTAPDAAVSFADCSGAPGIGIAIIFEFSCASSACDGCGF